MKFIFTLLAISLSFNSFCQDTIVATADNGNKTEFSIQSLHGKDINRLNVWLLDLNTKGTKSVTASVSYAIPKYFYVKATADPIKSKYGFNGIAYFKNWTTVKMRKYHLESIHEFPDTIKRYFTKLPFVKQKGIGLHCGFYYLNQANSFSAPGPLRYFEISGGLAFSRTMGSETTIFDVLYPGDGTKEDRHRAFWRRLNLVADVVKFLNPIKNEDLTYDSAGYLDPSDQILPSSLRSLGLRTYAEGIVTGKIMGFSLYIGMQSTLRNKVEVEPIFGGGIFLRFL